MLIYATPPNTSSSLWQRLHLGRCVPGFWKNITGPPMSPVLCLASLGNAVQRTPPPAARPLLPAPGGLLRVLPGRPGGCRLQISRALPCTGPDSQGCPWERGEPAQLNQRGHHDCCPDGTFHRTLRILLKSELLLLNSNYSQKRGRILSRTTRWPGLHFRRSKLTTLWRID